MANTIANSSAKNNYFTIAGSAAIGATTQPRINTAVIAGILDTSLTAHPGDTGFVSTTIQVPYTGYDRTSIIRGLSNTVRGAANTVIRSPGSDFYRENVHALDAVETFHRASGIRQNLWNSYSGNWTTIPAVANDYTALGRDDEAISSRAAPGEFAYAYAGSGVRRSYPARTQ